VKIFYLGLVILLLGSFILTGCNGTSTTTATTTTKITTTTASVTSATAAPQNGGTFRLIDDRPPGGTLGWFAEPGPPAGSWYQTMFEGLMSPQYNGSIKPKLAAGWKIADDLTSITIDLQKNVKFHDGSDFNAEAVKWNFDVFIEAKMSSVKRIVSVEIIDIDTIKINLKQYVNTIFYDLSAIPMVSKVAFDTKGGKEYLRWNPVGTGPFKYDSYTPDQSIKVVKFGDYWQKGKPYLDAVVVTWISDTMTAAASFEAGEADAVASNYPQICYDLQKKGYEIIYGYTGASTLLPDSKNADSPLAKIKVRQAIDYAIDRDALVKARGYGFWTPAYQFAAPDSSAYVKDLAVRSYNPDKAKQLLAEAGYGSGLSITIYGDGSSADKDAAVAIQGFLSKVGITADLQWLDFMGFAQYVMGGWTNGLLYDTNGFAPNMNQAMIFGFSQTSIFNPSMARFDEVEALINASAATRDPDPKLTQAILQKIHEMAEFIPTYCIIRAWVVNSKVHDTKFLQAYGPYTWDPTEAWMSK
jgi:peptide/nickel transport system substrate-binding protein